MITALLSGIIVGFILAIPPGPIAVAVMKSGLKDTFRKGIGIGFGAALMDILYCLVLMLATSSIVDETTSLMNNNQLLVLFFQIACVAIMIGYGILNLRVKRTPLPVEGAVKKRSLVDRISDRGPFFIGVGISLTNLANPTFLPSLAYMTVLMQQYGAVDARMSDHILFSFGFGVGMLGWISLLLRMMIRFRDRMSPRFIEGLHRFAGLTFIGFGTYIGFRVFSVVKWPELLRLALTL
jgi:threonine/homoserine/homoserine lactone efflux protein